jgi:hypothetical protein
MEVLELLARKIHERYLTAALAAGRSRGETPALVAWDQLPEDYREANRAQAAQIVEKIRSIGCSLVPAVQSVDFAFTADELDGLARAEHERWMRQRRAAGWSYGPVRDDVERRHPSLIPYDDLSLEEQQKDSDAVLQIPALLAEVGLGVRRDQPGS